MVLPIEVGTPVQLSPLVRRLTAPNPGMMTGPGTNTYLVGTDEIAVIDPGPALDEHVDAIVAAGAGRIRWILTTHTHADHWPGAAALRDRTGATTFGFTASDGFEPDTRLADGDRVAGAGFALGAVHTPGHASNHLCYLLEQERLLFSGDHVMQGSTVVIRPPDGDMAVYLASLARVAALDLAAIAPGHGTLITDPAAKLDEYVTHRLAREAQVLDAVVAGDATVDAVVARLYADVDEKLHPVARHTVHAHLRKLRDEGRVVGDGIDGEWRVAR